MKAGRKLDFHTGSGGCQQSLGKLEFWSQWLISPALGRLLGKVLAHINFIIFITEVFALALRMEFLSVDENLVSGQILADIPLLSFGILLQINQNKQILLLTSSFRLGGYWFCKLVLCYHTGPVVHGSESLPSYMAVFWWGVLIFLCDSYDNIQGSLWILEKKKKDEMPWLEICYHGNTKLISSFPSLTCCGVFLSPLPHPLFLPLKRKKWLTRW